MNISLTHASAFALLAVALITSGCESTPETMVAPDGTVFRRTDDLDKVWLRDGFTFAGYDALLVEPTQIDGIETKDEKEAERLNLFARSLPQHLVAAITLQEVFPIVTTRADDVPSGRKALRLETRVTDFNRGSSAMRYGIGFGAGRPSARVAGRITEVGSEEPLFRFETDESGDFFSGFSGSRSLQNEASFEMAEELADFIARAAGNQPIEYR